MSAYFARHRDFYRTMFIIGIPVALQNLLTTSVSMVDTLMIGTQGELALAAVGLCNQFGSLLFSFYWGFASAGTLFFAQHWGAKNEKGITSAYGITIALMFAVSAVFFCLACFAPQWVMSVYTDKSAVSEVGVEYLRIIGFSYPAQVIAMAISCVMRSTENVKSPLYASILSIATNTFLNWVLIFGKLGAPALGVRGAAIASVTAAYINMAALYLFSTRDGHGFAIRFKEHFRISRAQVAEYAYKAAPMVANETLYGVGQMLVNMVLGRQNEAGIAAMAIFRVIEGMIYAFFVGLCNASSVMVGKSVGAGELEKAYGDAKRFAWLCPLITLTICLVILPLRSPILSLFTLSEQTRQYMMIMLVIYTFAAPLRTCSYIMNNIFRAGGEPLVGAAFEITSLFVISVPLVYLSGMVYHLEFLLVFSSMYVEEIVKLFIGLTYLRSARWIRPVTPEGRAALEAFRSRIARARRARPAGESR